MLIKRRIHQQGFTFTELMVALVINLFLAAGLILLFLSNINHYRKTIQINRLNYQLESALYLMSSNIRRAGFWNNAYSDVGTGQNNNPFMASSVDMTTVNNNCILFAYDKDGNNSLPAISNSYDDERYGYRLNNQAIEARPPGATFNCTATNWEVMTDTNTIEITTLNFAITTKTINTGPGSIGMTMRSVDITLTGRLKSDTSVTKTLTQHIKVQNDKFIP